MVLPWLHSDLYKSDLLLFHQDDMGEKGDKACHICFITWNPREMKMLITNDKGHWHECLKFQVTFIIWGFWKKYWESFVMFLIPEFPLYVGLIDWPAWIPFGLISGLQSQLHLLKWFLLLPNICTCEHCPLGILPYLRICSKVSHKSYHFYLYILTKFTLSEGKKKTVC